MASLPFGVAGRVMLAPISGGPDLAALETSSRRSKATCGVGGVCLPLAHLLSTGGCGGLFAPRPYSSERTEGPAEPGIVGNSSPPFPSALGRYLGMVGGRFSRSETDH